MPDYSKFDAIVDSDDEDGHELPPLEEKQSVPSLLAQHDAMLLLAGWLNGLHMITGLSEAENAKLMRLIAIQDKATTPDARKRYAAITSFFEEDERWVPPIVAMVALCHVAEERTNSESDECRKLTGARAMLLAMSSLNILAACYVNGASKLFRVLEEDPNGEVAGRLERFEYAMELVANRPEGFSPGNAATKRISSNQPEHHHHHHHQQQQQQQQQQQRRPQPQPQPQPQRQAAKAPQPTEKARTASPDRERRRLPMLSRILRVTAPATRRLREVGTSLKFQGVLLLCVFTLRFCYDQMFHGHSTFWLLGGHQPTAQMADEL